MIRYLPLDGPLGGIYLLRIDLTGLEAKLVPEPGPHPLCAICGGRIGGPTDPRGPNERSADLYFGAYGERLTLSSHWECLATRMTVVTDHFASEG
jgi:hypothetical protein